MPEVVDHETLAAPWRPNGARGGQVCTRAARRLDPLSKRGSRRDYIEPPCLEAVEVIVPPTPERPMSTQHPCRLPSTLRPTSPAAAPGGLALAPVLWLVVCVAAGATSCEDRYVPDARQSAEARAVPEKARADDSDERMCRPLPVDEARTNIARARDEADDATRAAVRRALAAYYEISQDPTPNFERLRRAAYEDRQFHDAARWHRETLHPLRSRWRDILKGKLAAKARDRARRGEPLCTAPTLSYACRCYQVTRSFDLEEGPAVRSCGWAPGDLYLLSVEFDDRRALFPIAFRRVRGGASVGYGRVVSVQMRDLLGQPGRELLVEGYIVDSQFNPHCGGRGCSPNTDWQFYGFDWAIARRPEPHIQTAVVDQSQAGSGHTPNGRRDNMECLFEGSAESCAIWDPDQPNPVREVEWRPDEGEVRVGDRTYSTADSPVIYPDRLPDDLLAQKGGRRCDLGPWAWAGLEDNAATSMLHQELSVRNPGFVEECLAPLPTQNIVYLEVAVTDEGIDAGRSGIADRSSDLLDGLDAARIEEVESCVSRELAKWDWQPDPDRGPEPPYTLLAPVCHHQ